MPRAPSPAVRDESRRDLRATNKDFAVPMKGKVAITIRPLQAASNLPALLRAWKEVIEVHPDARLWVIGDGKQRDELAQLRRDLDLGWNVIMPGVFEETDELLAAADLYLADGAGHVGRLLAAMAAGLPIVAQDSPTHREMLGGAGHGSLLYDKAGPELVRAITRILDQPAQWYDAGAFHRTIVERQFSMQQMLDAYEHLLFVDSAKWLGGDIR